MGRVLEWVCEGGVADKIVHDGLFVFLKGGGGSKVAYFPPNTCLAAARSLDGSVADTHTISGRRRMA